MGRVWPLRSGRYNSKFAQSFTNLWMADEVVGMIGMEDKSLSACDKASSTLAINVACYSFLRLQKVSSFSQQVHLTAFVAASSFPWRISSPNCCSFVSTPRLGSGNGNHQLRKMICRDGNWSCAGGTGDRAFILATWHLKKSYNTLLTMVNVHEVSLTLNWVYWTCCKTKKELL